MGSDPPPGLDELPIVMPDSNRLRDSLFGRSGKKKRKSLSESLFGRRRKGKKKKSFADSLFGKRESLRDSLYGKYGPASLPEPIDSPWSIPPGGLEAQRAFEVDDEIGDAKLVELIATVHGIECWRGERQDGTSVSVHAVLPGATEEVRAHFVAKAVDMQELAQQNPIEGMLWVTTVDPLTGAYVGEASPIGTAADLTAAQWSVERQLDCVRQVSETMSRLHAAGLVHGCLRPENVLLDEELRPVVGNVQAVDIAAACRADPAADVKRSPYAAPEVRAGQPADARADVFSLGRFMHHVLLGSEPKESDEDLPKLTSLAKAPSGLTRIIRRCTMRDPAERYADAQELVEELNRYAQGEEVGLSHPKVVEAYDQLRHAAILRQQHQEGRSSPPKGRKGPRWREAAEERAKPTPKAAPEAAPAEGAERATRSLLLPLAAGAVGLLLFSGALVTAYLIAEAAIVPWVLATVGGLLLSQAVPGFGPRPVLTRVAAAVAVIALLVFVDPVGLLAASGSQSKGLNADDVNERVATLLAEQAAGRTMFQAIDLSGADLSGRYLGGLVFDGSSLQGAICKGTSFAGTSLLNVNVTKADFSGANLDSVNATQLEGWPQARCDDSTSMPAGWTCKQGHPFRAMDTAK